MTEKIMVFLSGNAPYLRMRQKCREEVNNYNIDKVLSKELFSELGIV